mgnify:CR=1 FL=1
MVKKPELAQDPRFVSTTDRATNQAALKEILESVFVAYWIDAFNTAGVPHARINDYAAALADPQTAHMGWVQPLELPNGKKTQTFASPIRLNGQSLPIRRSPPGLAQHTEESRARLATKETS